MGSILTTNPSGQVPLVLVIIERKGPLLYVWAQLDHQIQKMSADGTVKSLFFFANSLQNNVRPGRHVLWQPSELPIFFAQPPCRIDSKQWVAIFAVLNREIKKILGGAPDPFSFFLCGADWETLFLCDRSRLDSGCFQFDERLECYCWIEQGCGAIETGDVKINNMIDNGSTEIYNMIDNGSTAPAIVVPFFLFEYEVRTHASVSARRCECECKTMRTWICPPAVVRI